VPIRPAPVPGFEGTRSFALPEFDPFWEKVVEADVAVGMHASDDGMTKYVNVWEGTGGGEYLPFKTQDAFEAVFRSYHRGIMDAMASAICHGLFDRFPSLRVIPVENGSRWVGPLLDALGHIVRLIGADRVVFGSDYLHPEGLTEPASYVDQLEGLGRDDIARIMGGNLAGILRIAA
jgi:predicted TIM-barrel fold metal-dependent hydrolase